MSPEMQSQNVSVKIEQKYLNILNKISEQADISRHKLIHDILEKTIEELEFGRRIGFFQMVILIRNLARKINLLSDTAIDKVEQEERSIPIRLSKDFLDRLDELAKQTDRTRHYLMKRFIEVGADELDKLYNKKVPVTNGLMMRHLKKKLDSLCKEGEQAYNMYNSEIE
jgi:predicted DNA-binding protein